MPRLSGTGRRLLLYQGCIAACDAALVAAGMRVEGDEGAHVLRLRTTIELLGLDEELGAALEDARRVRAGSAHMAGLVFDDQVDEARDATARLIAAVDEFVANEQDG